MIRFFIDICGIQIWNKLFLGFKFQSYFLGLDFQTACDSGFRFQMGGIQDLNYVFQGPIGKIPSCSGCLSVLIYELYHMLEGICM